MTRPAMSIISCQHKCMLIYTESNRMLLEKYQKQPLIVVPQLSGYVRNNLRCQAAHLLRNSILSMPLRAMTILRLYLLNNTFHLKPHKEPLSGQMENKSWTYYWIYFLWLSPGRVGEAVVAFVDVCLLFGVCCFWVLINAMLTTSVTYTSEQRSSLTQCAARSEGRSTEIYHNAGCWEEDRRERENTQSKAESVSLSSLEMLELVQTAPLVQDLSKHCRFVITLQKYVLRTIC